MKSPFRWMPLALMLCGPAGIAADFERGMEAVEKQDWPTAVAEFRALAEAGHPDAQVNLGNLYAKGYGVEQSYSTAFRWYLRAAEQGHPVAQGKLGLMYFYGLGLRKDHVEAERWFRSAAENGNADAASVLASLYASGEGVAKDPAAAYFWYSIAMERGHPDAEAYRNELVETMSPGEIGEALDRLAAWRARHADSTITETFEPAATPGEHRGNNAPRRREPAAGAAMTAAPTGRDTHRAAEQASSKTKPAPRKTRSARR